MKLIYQLNVKLENKFERDIFFESKELAEKSAITISQISVKNKKKKTKITATFHELYSEEDVKNQLLAAFGITEEDLNSL